METQGIGCHGWFADPSWTLAINRGMTPARYVLIKLHAVPAFRPVWSDVMVKPHLSILGPPLKDIDERDITRAQWRELLDRSGASPAEVVEVLYRLGFNPYTA